MPQTKRNELNDTAKHWDCIWRLPSTVGASKGAGLMAECVLAGGDPSKEISDAAEREGCDLIAMSTHGHRFIKDMLYGSVANEVRHLSRIPVLLVRRLAEQGLITHERYRGVQLTKAGRFAALRTIRRHRVIEAYLIKALGYPWDRVHDEAERLEHVAVGTRVCIQRVGDRDAEQLRYLAELGIMPGRQVEVLARAPFEGPISLRVGRLTRSIGAGLAKQILVSA